MKEKNMRKRSRTVFPFLLKFFLALPLFSLPALAQDAASARTISGTVRGEKGESLAGVNVLEKGTGKGTATNEKGAFKLTVSGDNATLVFTNVGYGSQEVKVSGTTSWNIVLKSESKALDDIVVIGYGSVKKVDVTGSVSSVKAADLKGTQLTSADQALQGRAAGVQVTNSDATPGARPNIRIRGTNSLGTSSEPLFVVDGYPSNEDISSINPNDIESIDVLKDASATAIYGSRGANGVILITTKRGKAGKLTIGIEAYHGVATVTKTLELMNARQYAEYRNEVVKNTSPATAKPFASPAILDYLSTHSTDWQKAIFQSAPVTSLQLNMSGGDEKTKFLLSGEYFNQQGIILNTGFQRGTLRVNLDREISKRLKFGFTSLTGRTVANNSRVNTLGGVDGGVLLNAIRFNPAVPVYDTSGNGKYSFSNYFLKDAASNPASDLDQLGNPAAYAQSVSNANYLLRGQITMFGEYEIATGLKLKLLVGGEYLNNWQNYYEPYDLFEQAQNNGTARRFSRVRTNWLNENNLSYTKNFASGFSLSALLGFSFQQFNDEASTASATNFFTNAFTFNNIGAGAAASVNSAASQNQLNSYYARVNGKLWNNLLVTATLRADGSSKFGANYKYGYFPSGAIAYKLTDLPLIQRWKVVTELKARVGYGITGNQEIDPYLSVFGYDLAGAFSPGVPAGNLVFGTTRQVAVAASRPANPNLRWEQTSAFNTGLDIGLWSNKLTITLDYYNKQTKDLLWSVALPATTGFSSAFKNLGSVENKGVEIGISATPVANKNFRWNTLLNLAMNKNKVISLGTEPFRLLGGSSFQDLITRDNFAILQPGYEIGKFFMYTFDGIWQSQSEIDKSNFSAAYKAGVKPGYAKYVDVNGDGKITAADKLPISGSAYPKYVFGFTNTFSYKSFDLNIFLQGQQGNKILNLNKYWIEYPAGSNKSADVLDRWHGEGTSNTLPAAGYETSRLIGTDFLEDGSYLRLKSLSLAYQFSNTKWLQAAKITSIRLYVTSTNLLTLTHYKGYDPEVNSYNSSLFLQGVDQGAYATAKSIIFGIKLGL